MLHGWTNEIAAHHGNNENIVLPSMIGLSATQISPLKEIFSHKNIKMITIFTIEGHLLIYYYVTIFQKGHLFTVFSCL